MHASPGLPVPGAGTLATSRPAYLPPPVRLLLPGLHILAIPAWPGVHILAMPGVHIRAMPGFHVLAIYYLLIGLVFEAPTGCHALSCCARRPQHCRFISHNVFIN